MDASSWSADPVFQHFSRLLTSRLHCWNGTAATLRDCWPEHCIWEVDDQRWASTVPGYHGTGRHNQGVYRQNGNIQVDAPKNVAFRLWFTSYFVMLLLISYVFSLLFAVFCLYIMNLLTNFDVFWLGNEILCICLVLAVLACRFFFMVFVVKYKVATIHATSDNCTVF